MSAKALFQEQRISCAKFVAELDVFLYQLFAQDLNDFTQQGVDKWRPSKDLLKVQSGGHVDGWTIV
jgi:hypothetical protein